MKLTFCINLPTYVKTHFQNTFLLFIIEKLPLTTISNNKLLLLRNVFLFIGYCYYVRKFFVFGYHYHLTTKTSYHAHLCQPVFWSQEHFQYFGQRN